MDSTVGKREMDVSKKTTRSAKQNREYALFTKLQNQHGYTLMEPGRGVEKMQLMFDHETKKMSMTYVMRLAVPADSALGVAIAKSRKAQEKKAKKR